MFGRKTLLAGAGVAAAGLAAYALYRHRTCAKYVPPMLPGARGCSCCPGCVISLFSHRIRPPPTRPDREREVNDALERTFKEYELAGQGHVFQHIWDCPVAEKQEFLAMLASFNVLQLNVEFARLTEKVEEKKISPMPPGIDSSKETPERLQAWRAAGLRQIADNKLAVVLLAGGQGTRLGSNLPKGALPCDSPRPPRLAAPLAALFSCSCSCSLLSLILLPVPPSPAPACCAGMYNIGLATGKTLLQLQAERLRRLRTLASELSGKPVEAIHIPWYIMTSDATMRETSAYLTKANYFGLPAEDVLVFEQGLLPALDNSGKLLMQGKTKLAFSPNGNGGVYAALEALGVLEDMVMRDLSHVHVVGVDNLLLRVADPTVLGFALESKVDVVNKVILKTDPAERVGVMCLRDDAVGICEYSELSKEQSEARAADGRLLYSAANIANHLFTLPFIGLCAQRASELPFHVARKKIPFMDGEGKLVTPEKENGVKFEMFVFDVFGFADKAQVASYAVPREEEFAPIKNADSGVEGKVAVDSPAAARQALYRYNATLLQRAGAILKGFNESIALEISPLITYDGEGLEQFKGKVVELPNKTITPAAPAAPAPASSAAAAAAATAAAP